MFSHAWETIKGHPVATGIVVVVGVVIFLMISGWGRGGSAATQVVSNAPQVSPAEVAAQAQTQIAQISASRDTNIAAIQLQAQHDALAYQSGADSLTAQVTQALAQMSTNVQMTGIDASKAVTLHGQDTALSAVTVQTNAQTAQVIAGYDSQNHLVDALTGMIGRFLNPTPAPVANPQVNAPQPTSQTNYYVTNYSPTTGVQPPQTSVPVNNNNQGTPTPTPAITGPGLLDPTKYHSQTALAPSNVWSGVGNPSINPSINPDTYNHLDPTNGTYSGYNLTGSDPNADFNTIKYGAVSYVGANAPQNPNAPTVIDLPYYQLWQSDGVGQGMTHRGEIVQGADGKYYTGV